MHDMTPIYLKDLLRPYIPKRNLRSASMNLLDHEPYNLKGYGYRAFSVSAPRLWNSLPDHIRNSQSVEIFKSRVKTKHIPILNFNNTCYMFLLIFKHVIILWYYFWSC